MRKIFDRDNSVAISAETIVFTVFFLLGLYFLYYVREIVVIVFLAVILMSALHPGVRWLEKRLRFPKILAILLLYLTIIVVIAISMIAIVPPLVAEVPTLLHSLPLSQLPNQLNAFQFTVPQLSEIFNQVRVSFDAVYGILSSTFGGIIAFLTIMVMTLYMLLDREHLHKKMLWFSKDEKHVEYVKEFIDKVEVQLGGWVRSQLFLMLTIGVMSYVGLALLSIPYALPLALSAGLLEILPSIGPAIAALPAILIAYTTSGPAAAGFVTLFYILIHQLENHIIVPNLMRHSLNVSPLITIVTILTGIKVGGLMGAFLSVPFYIVLRSAYTLWVKIRLDSSVIE